MDYSKAAQESSSSSSKHRVKRRSSQEDCEHYSFPKSTLAAITCRIVFTEIDRQDPKTFRSPNAARAFPTNERYMRREDIAKFNTLLEEVVWMCDVVLHNQIADHVWARFFKDGRYHHAITSELIILGRMSSNPFLIANSHLGMFNYVREFVWSLLDRESPGALQPLWQSKRLKIQMVSPGTLLV